MGTHPPAIRGKGSVTGVQSHQAKDRSADGVTAVRPFQIRGRFFTAIALRLAGRPDEKLLEELDAQLRQMPNFFAGAPLVIDLEHAAGLLQKGDLLQLIEHLRSRDLSVFGVQSGTPEQVATAAAAGLISLAGGRDAPLQNVRRDEGRAQTATSTAAPETPPAAEALPPKNLMVTTPVRSGQTVFADRGDLVVVGPVGSGAELVAAGNIHVYGQLRGRAMAGVNGDETARIFCQSLDAELLAIAGLYRTSETLGPDIRRKGVQAFLEGERLCVEPLGPNQTRDRSGQ